MAPELCIHISIALLEQEREKHTFLVLLNIEPAEKHNRLLSEDSTVDLVRWIYTWSIAKPDQSAHHSFPITRRLDSLIAHPHHATTATESIVQTTEIDGADTELTECGRTHDAWFHCDVEVCFVQDRRGVFGENLAHGHEFGVAGSLGEAVSC